MTARAHESSSDQQEHDEARGDSARVADGFQEMPSPTPAGPAPVSTAATAGEPPPVTPGVALALQRTAGNASVAGLIRSHDSGPTLMRAAPLARPPATQAATTPEQAAATRQVRLAITNADANRAVAIAADVTVLAVTTPAQRAGLIRVLTDLVWTRGRQEQAILVLLRFKGEHAQVAAALDAIGYREKVLDSVDDDALQVEAQTLLGAKPTAPGGGGGAIQKALDSGDPKDVTAISDFSAATSDQRLRLLKILLDMSWSSAEEETKILDVLASAGKGLGHLMTNVKALGLKQRLFDHIDKPASRKRLRELLEHLGDEELNQDLRILDMGFVEGVGEAWEGGKKKFGEAMDEKFKDGILSGVASLIWDAIKGLFMSLDPTHYLGLAEDALNAFAQGRPARGGDRLITLARDAVGALSGLLGLAAVGVGAFVVIAAPAPPVAALAGLLATILGTASLIGFIIFGLLWLLKLVWNLGEAGAATTEQEMEREREDVGGDITLAFITVAFAAVAALLKFIWGKIRPAKGPPPGMDEQVQDRGKKLEDQAAKGKKLEQDLKDAAAKRGEPIDPAAEPKQPSPDPSKPRKADVAKPPATTTTAPADPWPDVQARYPQLTDAHVEILRLLGIDPALVERCLKNGVKPDPLVLRAVEGGPRAVAMLDALTTRLAKAGLPSRTASRIVELAVALDQLFPGRGLLETVHDLATSGKLQNPQELANVLNDINNGDANKITELEIAAARARIKHRVQLGTVQGVGADVVDIDATEAMHVKDIASADLRAVGENLNSAANQHAGEGARGRLKPGAPDTEVPPLKPDGTPYTRTAEIIIRNPDNPLYKADKATIEQFVRKTLKDAKNGAAVDQVRVTNGDPGSPHTIVGPF